MGVLDSTAGSLLPGADFLGIPDALVLTDSVPVPTLGPDDVAMLAYCGNLNLIGRSPEALNTAFRNAQKHLNTL